MDLMQSFQSESGSDIEELKNNINDYNKLKVNLTNKIGRIRSTIYKKSPLLAGFDF